MKKLDYVRTVVNCWKKQIQTFYEQNRLHNDDGDLCEGFNRDFSNAYLKGHISRDMFIEKSKGNYHRLYHDANYLNTDVVTDFPELFSGFLIDLRDIRTKTRMEMNKSGIIRLFENLLKGNPDSKGKLNRVLYPTTKAQYETGI